MTYDDEILMRRIDGELPPEEGERIDAAARADPELAARLAAMRGLRTAARAAFPVEGDPRDQALARLIGAAEPARSSPLDGVRRALADAFAPRRAALWGGLATAAFVGGLLLAPLLSGEGEEMRIQSGGVLADAGLVRVLDSRLAADGADAQGRAIGLTFRDGEGRWCRTFRAGEVGLAGLACRQDDSWTMQALAPMTPATGEVRTAGAETPEVILAAIDATLAGETVDGAAEARARDAGWR
ncbi:hypothetical protein D8I30_12485 [Brevundimonas naejangsanensis]|uniref:Anti-sigma factor n=1 Tax=Brevundimonas naejangsanensis TaxID=588932 RepID=A0A494RHA1_9CAUL|nr:hypothetical protein [Brevundimonas naejangsanensis]AYG95897.1 hypothetical protein D8I30_12485 [Brevundimonas naejangsanensis]